LAISQQLSLATRSTWIADKTDIGHTFAGCSDNEVLRAAEKRGQPVRAAPL